MERRRIQRFEVLDHLGSGGMGAVYRARDPQLERDVAIKVLAEPSAQATSELATHETLDLRKNGPTSSGDLLREARLMAQLSHQNVLPVYEVGLADDGVVFVVMEHIDGSDLRAWLSREPRTLAAILDVFAQAGRGLTAAHQRGIVHRDFKPDNVLIGGDGRVRVADFGLSRLSTKPSALVRIDDGGGTPRYMAPELWLGSPATVASDVFAFCVAAAEAIAGEAIAPELVERRLRERGVSSRLRALLVAGMSADPASRPDLGAVIAALGGRSRRRELILAGGAAAIGAIAIAVALARPSHARDCRDDPALFAGRWDVATRMAFVEALAKHPAAEEIDGIVALVDEDRAAIEQQLRGTCRAADDGELTEAELHRRTSCLERRVFEIGAVVAAVQRHAPELSDVQDRVQAIPVAGECAELTAPPLAADSSAAVELYRRFAASWDLPRPDRPAALAAIERDASALGERELEARAAQWLGNRLRALDLLDDADAALARAYRLAHDVHAASVEALALAEQSHAAGERGDQTAARSFAETARAVVDRPGVAALTRARVYWVLGHAARERNDRGARWILQTGLDIIARDGHRLASTEVALRIDLMRVLVEVDGQVPAGIKLQRETVDYAKAAFGEHSVDYAVTLNMLAFALRSNDELAAAIPYRHQALAIMLESLPADSSMVIFQRSDYATDLAASGDFVHAREQIASALTASEHNPALGRGRPTLLGDLASSTFELGHFDEAQRLYERSIEEFTTQNGRDHPLTLEYRLAVADRQLELGKLDAAERSIAALEAGYKARPESRDLKLAALNGIYKAQLELARGKPRDAEALTRAALTVWDELHGDDTSRMDMFRTLAWSLIEQRRFAEARVWLDKGLAIARAHASRDDFMAQFDVKLARIEAGEGHRADALARARRARAVLDRFPGTILARKEADALLAELSR